MLKWKNLVAGGSAIALNAVAADNSGSQAGRLQTMTVQLPDGGVARIKYSGPVKPRITFIDPITTDNP